jgi:hypothetical protein
VLRMRGRSVIYPKYMKNPVFIWWASILLNAGWAGEVHRHGTLSKIALLSSLASMLLAALALKLDEMPKNT